LDDAKVILKRISNILGGLNNREMSEYMGVSYNTLNTWIKRNSIPMEQLSDLVQKRQTSYDWLLTGKGLMYLEEKKSNSTVDTGFQDCEIHNNKGSIAINISKSDFKDDSAEIEELISLLKYAPKSFIIKIIEKLRAFKELSQI
jgi:hypothetical protein